MKSDSIETITAEIKRLLYKENRISINDIMKTIHYPHPHDMVLIAIGYLLREDSIYFNEQYMIIEYKTFYF